MAIATIASRILGFARIMVIAAVLGTTALGNTFQSTNSISNILFDLLAAGALSAALVPSLVKAMNRNKDELDQLVGSLLSVSILILGVFTIISLFFARDIAEIIFARSPIETREQQIETGTILLWFFLPQIMLYGIGAISLAVLTAKKKFVTTALAPIGSSVVIIISLGIFWLTTRSASVELSTGSIIILGVAGTAACLVFIAIPFVAAMRSNVRMLPSMNLKSGFATLSESAWAIAIQASAAIVLGAAILIGNEINGAVVAYQLAFVFFLAPYGVISQSFSTVLLPDLSSTSELETQNNDFKDLVGLMMKYTYRPMVIASGLLIAIAFPLMRIVTHGRAQEGIELVEISFIMLIAGLLPYSIFQATSRVFFAKGNIRLPALSVFAISLLVAVLSLLISKEVSGNSIVYIMGLSHSSTYLLSAVFLIAMLLKEKYRVLPDKTSTLIIALSVFYALGGLALSHRFDFASFTFSVLYILVFLAATIFLIGLMMPKRHLKQLKAIVLNKSIAGVK